MGWLDKVRSWVGGGSAPATPAPAAPAATAPPPMPAAPANPQQAQARLTQAQADAQANLNHHPPGTAPLPCAGASPKEPCDLSVFEVTEKRQKFDIEWSLPELSDRLWAALGIPPEPAATPLEPPKERAYPAKFQLGPVPDEKGGVLPNGSTIEVIALGPNDSKKTTLALEVRTDFKFCGAAHHHPEIQVKGPNGNLETFPQRTKHELTVYRPARVYDALPQGFDGFIGYFWALSATPAVYEAHALVCGSRKPAATVGTQMCWIRVYPSDQYEFTLKLPPVFKIGYQRYAGRGSQEGVSSKDWSSSVQVPGMYKSESGHGEKRDEATGSRTSYRSSSEEFLDESVSDARSFKVTKGKITATATKGTTYEGIQGTRTITTDSTGEGKPSYTVGPEEARSSIKAEFRHNGTKLDVLEWFNNTLNLVRRFTQTIDEIYEAIEAWKPKVGWMFSFDLCFFTGSFGAAWGARECVDFRVFQAYKVTASLEVLRASVTLAFGVDARVKGIGLVVKVSGTVEGAVSVKSTLERVSPDQKKEQGAALEGSITGKLEFEGSVVSDRWFEINGTVETGIKVDGSLQAGGKRLGVHVEKVTWQGITTKGKIHLVLWGDEDAEIEIMKPKRMGGPFDFP